LLKYLGFNSSEIGGGGGGIKSSTIHPSLLKHINQSLKLK